jgi:hypothetical protein
MQEHDGILMSVVVGTIGQVPKRPTPPVHSAPSYGQQRGYR